VTRILAISDTHLSGEIPPKLVELAETADIIIHTGDFEKIEIYNSFSRVGRLEAVFGNSDPPELRRILPSRKTIVVEGVKIGMVHKASHSPDLLGPELLAREMDVDVLVFGHHHIPYLEKGERLLICPGSPTVPRMSYPTVVEIEINRGEVHGRIIPIGRARCDYIECVETFAEEESQTAKRSSSLWGSSNLDLLPDIFL
jgi:hypothetical protein